MSDHDEDELRAVIAEYEATKKAALAKRDAALRAFHAAGWRAVDLQRVTGYSRETIRQALHPEARLAANTNRRKTTGTTVRPPADYVPYGDRKRYVVAETLAELHGPTSGSVTLPHHLDWSGNAEYVLDRPTRLASMYKTVLTEATTTSDLRDWLDGATLIRLWPQLWLPAQLRRLWEDRFHELGAARTTAS
ncbi:hypothetical protein GCM10010399_55360 [Dactylosporangium fulvum]|uniref:Transcriptional regulator n=1 Tax=Dactylosporangium fulvum TaxID=53359 RepID=A0ABY5W0P8_9ACTN|nr:hypothetical protein [Dactylosporangium fulvum]UWP83097.1 hypothetical protein Dfulv_01955 [Dactylosporangium fulvum]